MPVITSIKQQKKKNRVNVYLDGKFGFGIDLDNFVLLKLRLEQELSEEEIEKIVKKAEFQKTLDKLLRFAMARPRSEKEINTWLWRKKVPEVIQKDLFAKLKHFELVDDTKFAKWWIEARQSFSPKAKKILRYELRSKGIKKEIIDETLSEIEVDEGKIASELLRAKETKWKNVEKTKVKQKMVEYLVRKGFDSEIAKQAIREYNMGEDDK